RSIAAPRNTPLLRASCHISRGTILYMIRSKGPSFHQRKLPLAVCRKPDGLSTLDARSDERPLTN
ncbi:MAG: hypothetical protein K0M47_14215, partial [Rhizobium sp.]|nr:hypothetical protein [Rhizobium sp.]